jgi:hypothetical protein
MCDPVSALTAAQIGGSLMQGYSSMQAGRAQRRLADAQAVAELDTATAQAEDIRRKTRSTRGAARAALAGAGVAVDAGSALDIDQDIAMRGFSDAEMALLTGQRRARQLRYEGRLAQIEGRQAIGASLLQAGSQLGQGITRSIFRPSTMPPAPIEDRSTRPGRGR